MKKLLVIWLVLYSFSMALPHAITSEIADLPKLFAHFEKHKNLEENISFLDFLVMHYSDNAPPDSEHNHEELPFKHHHDCTDNFCCSIFMAEVDRPEFNFSISPLTSDWPEHLVSAPQSASVSIFQPPRFI